MHEASEDIVGNLGELIVEKTASNLVDEIKKLSRQNQAAIIVEVLDTLDEEGEEIDDEELLRELQRREAEGMEGSVSFATCLRREGKWMFVSRTQQFAIISWHATDSR